MQDAVNLAWKLAMVTRGNAKPTLLDSYSPECSAVGEIVLRNATRLTDMGTLTQPAARTARDLALRFLLGFHMTRSRIAATMTEVDIAYGMSPLSVGKHSGERMPPAQYAGSSPGTGGVPRFVLFTADKIKGNTFAARYPALLESKSRPPPHPDRLFIVRPDGYVGLSACAADWNAAEEYLKKLAA